MYFFVFVILNNDAECVKITQIGVRENKCEKNDNYRPDTWGMPRLKPIGGMKGTL